jgi:hypothetical protein
MDLGFTEGAAIRPALRTFSRIRARRSSRHADSPAKRSGVAGARAASGRGFQCGHSGSGIVSHNCETCASFSELARMGVNLGKFDRVVALASSEHRQVHLVQRAHRTETAHGQLARQDGHTRRGRL